MKTFYTFNNLSQYKNCKHFITKKDINEKYAFSLALHTNEEKKDIITNRSKINALFPRMQFIVANQTHSDNIKIISHNNNSWLTDIKAHAIENCDALITNEKNIMLTILTADCVPVLLFDKNKKVVAVIHAGWKGTEQQITAKTVNKMKELFQSNPEDIIAGIAPSIGKCCYEVEWNVAKHFQNIKNGYEEKANKQMVDLPYINKIQLLESGLKEENIECSNICTSCEVEEYFSYRKEGGCSGRFMSIIGLKEFP
jgi:YfiH family protein